MKFTMKKGGAGPEKRQFYSKPGVTNGDLLVDITEDWLHVTAFKGSLETTKMVPLEADFPDIADDLEAAANSDPALAEALDDYREACVRSKDEQLSAKYRSEWSIVRKELAEEIRRIFERRKE